MTAPEHCRYPVNDNYDNKQKNDENSAWDWENVGWKVVEKLKTHIKWYRVKLLQFHICLPIITIEFVENMQIGKKVGNKWDHF